MLLQPVGHAGVAASPYAAPCVLLVAIGTPADGRRSGDLAVLD